jgi:hypothetical protein
VLASNPPTPSTQYNQRSASGQWIIRRYAPWLDPQYRDPLGLGPAAPGELRWFVTIDGVEKEWPNGLPFLHSPSHASTSSQASASSSSSSSSSHRDEELIQPKSRTFIPARVSDNPYLSDSDYEGQLQKLPEPLRSAMLYGDFSVTLSDKPMQLIPADWLRAATARHAALANTPAHLNTPMLSIGVDVARGGTDSTVLAPRRGNVFEDLVILPAASVRTGPEVGARVLSHRRDQATLVIDANGVGASVYDYLTTQTNLDPGTDVRSYVGSTSSSARDLSGNYGFVNLRSEAYWKLREMLDPSSPYPIAVPPDEELMEELLTITWEEQSGKIKVIPKKDLVKILGRSPDKADALVLASTVRDDDAPTVQARLTARARRLADARVLQDPSHPLYEETMRYGYGASHRRPRWNDSQASLPFQPLVWD